MALMMTSALSMQMVHGTSVTLMQSPQQPAIHMNQQMTTKVVLDMIEGPVSLLLRMQLMIGVTSQELEPEKSGLALRNRLEGDASQYKRLLKIELLRGPK